MARRFPQAHHAPTQRRGGGSNSALIMSGCSPRPMTLKMCTASAHSDLAPCSFSTSCAHAETLPGRAPLFRTSVQTKEEDSGPGLRGCHFRGCSLPDFPLLQTRCGSCHIIPSCTVPRLCKVLMLGLKAIVQAFDRRERGAVWGGCLDDIVNQRTMCTS